MQITIEDQAVAAARLSAAEIKLELAVSLYARGRLTLGQAAHLAALSQWQFQHALAERAVAVSYDEDELQSDRDQLTRL